MCVCVCVSSLRPKVLQWLSVQRTSDERKYQLVLFGFDVYAAGSVDVFHSHCVWEMRIQTKKQHPKMENRALKSLQQLFAMPGTMSDGFIDWFVHRLAANRTKKKRFFFCCFCWASAKRGARQRKMQLQLTTTTQKTIRLKIAWITPLNRLHCTLVETKNSIRYYFVLLLFSNSCRLLFLS